MIDFVEDTPREFWSEDEVIFLKDNYGKNSLHYIASNLQRDYQSVQNKLKHMGLNGGYRKSVNHDFFKTWSPDMAWCLGLLATDGSITSQKNVYNNEPVRKTIQLGSTDSEIVEKFVKFINSTYKIGKEEVRHTGFGDTGPFYNTCILSNNIYDDLISLGVIERKSLVMDFPTNYPVEYMADYIRGLWDGDGSIKLIDNKYIQCAFHSGSEQFISSIADEISKITSSEIDYKFRSTVFVINICGDNARKLCRYIYHDKMGDAYLTRKYNVWLKYKDMKGD